MDQALPPAHWPVVETPAGLVRGVRRSGSCAFLGIPFGQAPTGARRFIAPLPAEPWTGVRDATQHGPTPQRASEGTFTLIPEPSVEGDDTLNLNVFTPDVPSPSSLPVLVWFHGGGFISGSPASPWYDGAAFAPDGVILVVVSYRLGFDGFGWMEDAPANRGVLDWVVALEWVQQSIAAFGGDPARVTIGGQSAGGTAVLTLMGVTAAAGLFSSAIALSAGDIVTPASRAEQVGRRMAELAGVPPTLEGWRTVPEEVVLRLQAELAAASAGDDADPVQATVDFVVHGLGFAPWTDGQTVTAGVVDGASSGRALQIPLVLGSTDHEFTQAFATDPTLAGISALEVLERAGVHASAAAEYVLMRRSVAPAEVVGQFATDRIFRAPAHTVAARRAAVGAATWLYQFSWQSPVFGSAMHCCDVPFFFGILGEAGCDQLLGESPPSALASEFHGAAASFVAQGHPGWPRYAVDQPVVRVFDTASSLVDDEGVVLRALLPTREGSASWNQRP